MNNRELYKCAFSKLQTSGDLRMEEQEMEKLKPKFRCSAALAACLALLTMIGVSSGATYAATGGETANPIKGITIFLNGEELGPYDYTKNDDGSYTLQLPETEADDTEITVNTMDKPFDLDIKTKDEGGNSDGYSEVSITVKDQIPDSDPNASADPGSEPDAEYEAAGSVEINENASSDQKAK